MVAPSKCTSCPCIITAGRSLETAQEMEQSLQIRIKDPMFYPPVDKQSRKPCDACRRFSGLCNRRVYKEYQRNAFLAENLLQKRTAVIGQCFDFQFESGVCRNFE